MNMNDWTWEDIQAELHMTRLAEINCVRHILGEPMLNAWELINPVAHVNAVQEQAFAMLENGQVINSLEFSEF